MLTQEEKREKNREKSKKWRQKNQEKAREYSRKWAEKNREKNRENNKKWRENSLGNNKEFQRRREKALVAEIMVNELSKKARVIKKPDLVNLLNPML
jgi:Flp pilus assembly CpaF family ATPase